MGRMRRYRVRFLGADGDEIYRQIVHAATKASAERAAWNRFQRRIALPTVHRVKVDYLPPGER